MIREVISAIFLITGFVFLALSAIGVIRLPDFFSRMHSSGIGETLGIALMGLGFIIYTGINFTSVKVLLIALSVFIVNPVGTHLIGKAALYSDFKPQEEEKDANIHH